MKSIANDDDVKFLREQKIKSLKRAWQQTKEEMLKDFTFKLVVSLFTIAIMATVFKIFIA